MAKNSVFDYDVTAANNTDIASIPIDGAVTTPSQVDNIIREMMAQTGEFIKDLGGVTTVGGTANAITITANAGYTSYATGLVLSFKASSTNTGATTVNVNSIGAKAIRKFLNGAEAALEAGDIIIGQTYLMVYDTAANSAAGAWKLINPNTVGSTLTVTSTDASGSAGPTIKLLRDSASPAATDALGLISFVGKDSGGNEYLYAYEFGKIVSTTNGSEQGSLNWVAGNGASAGTMVLDHLGGLTISGGFAGTTGTFTSDLTSATDLTGNRVISSGGTFIGSTNAILAGGGGIVFLRPNGSGSSVGQFTVSAAGNVVITGSLSKGSGTFLIDHPLEPETRQLAHGFIEGPRHDLIYRGRVKLVNGYAHVDVDRDSNIDHPMTPGTFAVLTWDAFVSSLQNQTGFARLKPTAVIDGVFDIICEDGESEDEVTWVVMAERNDTFVRRDDPNTDENGRFIPERDKSDDAYAV